MNRRWPTTLLILVLGSGAACGTMRTEQARAPAARHLPLQLREGAAPVPFDQTSVLGPAALLGDKSVPLTGRRMQKWNPLWWLGNVDDPKPPDWYRPGSTGRRWLWQLRNPLHNFTFYVIGVADKPFTRSGKFPQAVFAPDGGWNWAVTKHSCVRLPFVSYNGERGRFYLGWRERGNFGGKVNFGRLKTADHTPQTSDLTTEAQGAQDNPLTADK